MFKNMKKRLKKRTFANTALLETNAWLTYLLTSDEACEEYRCIRVIKEKGDENIQEFRKHIIETVLEIVQSEKPITAMCKALIKNIKEECINRLVWTDEFHSHRQLIYDAINKENDDTDSHMSDVQTATLMLWCEAEGLCLCYLQMKMFDDTSEVDWWLNYAKLHEEYTRNLCQCIVDEANGEIPSFSATLAKAARDGLEDYERRLIEEAENITLWE